MWESPRPASISPWQEERDYVELTELLCWAPTEQVTKYWQHTSLSFSHQQTTSTGLNAPRWMALLASLRREAGRTSLHHGGVRGHHIWAAFPKQDRRKASPPSTPSPRSLCEALPCPVPSPRVLSTCVYPQVHVQKVGLLSPSASEDRAHDSSSHGLCSIPVPPPQP